MEIKTIAMYNNSTSCNKCEWVKSLYEKIQIFLTRFLKRKNQGKSSDVVFMRHGPKTKMTGKA